jgi:aldehyde:ferredoxin oxidoreductase
LSSGRSTEVSTADYAERFVGGRGIATKIYWDEMAPDIKAFDPENRLIIMTGPLAGFAGLAGSRWTICGKSAATSPEYFSNCSLGGSWGAQLKFAGYDGVVIQGKSDKPVYLLIEDRNAQIKNASHLWGRSAIEVREILKGEWGSSTRVLTTGPAGENLVSFAIVLADDDASGSSGFGAIMGSKKLKAIATRGSSKLTAAYPERLRQLSRYTRQLTQDTIPLQQRELVPGPNMRRVACHGCIRGCIRAICQAKDGTRGKFMCTSAVFYQPATKNYYGEWNPDTIEVPFHAARLCDGYGVDTNTIASMIIWLSRCYKAGILTDENTGIPISKLGSLEFIETLVRRISQRGGFGNILAQGTIRAAELVGKGAREMITDYVSKAGHFVLYDPRMFIVHGLLYAMEPRQPINQLHEIGEPMYAWIDWVNGVQGAYLSSDVFRKIAKRFWGSELAVDFSTYEGKALAAKQIQDRQYAKESLILCDIAPWPISHVRYSEDHVGDPTLESKILSTVTGREVGEEGLYRIGERVFNLQRAVLSREGHRQRESDKLDEVFYMRPLKTVPLNPECLAPGRDGELTTRKGAVVDREKFEAMKDEYYQLRGWDVASGLQTRAKLEEIGLREVVDDLEQKGLIAPLRQTRSKA